MSMAFRGRTHEWIERMRGMSVLDVAAELGHETRPSRGSDGGHVYGCPSCGAERRHTKSGDPRGAVGLVSNGLGWRCYQCDTSGDAIHFVSLDRHGNKLRDLNDTAKADVADWCIRWLGLSATSSTRTGAPGRLRAAVQRPEAPQPTYPPIDEVEALWTACSRVDADAGVSAWLHNERSIDPVLVADLALARVAPADGLYPAWACGSSGRSWTSMGYRVVVPLYDARGALRSLLFRFPAPGRKSMGARDFQRAGLTMLCPVARQLLIDRCWPELWPQGSRRIIVAEGELDHLTLATEWPDNATPPAVIGGFSGSWSLLKHIPSGNRLIIQTHEDEGGAKHASDALRAVLPRWKARELSIEFPPYFELVGEKVMLRE